MATTHSSNGVVGSHPKPTILLLHGSWHTPSHYEPLRQLLESNGFPTSCPTLATTVASPNIGLADDVKVVRNELTRLVVEESREVIVVGHSYGCIVMTEAVSEEFSLKTRQQEGKKGGVTNVLYVCGFLVEKGQSLAGALGGRLPPWILTDKEDMITPDKPEHVFYHDIPEEEQKQWTSKLVKNHIGPQFAPITHAAYLYHPPTYLYCENDQALPVQYQKLMVKNVSEATKITIAEEVCSASHSPFLSMPQRLVEVFQKMSNTL